MPHFENDKAAGGARTEKKASRRRIVPKLSIQDWEADEKLLDTVFPPWLRIGDRDVDSRSRR